MAATPSSPRRVGVLAHASVLDRSGYARRVLDAAGLVRRALPEAKVSVVSVESPRRLRDRAAREEVQAALARDGVDLVVVHAWPRRAGLARLSDALAARAVRRWVRRAHAEVLHAHGPRAVRTALAASRHALAVVADVHGDRAAETRLERGEPDTEATPPDPREAEPVRRASAVVYASEALARRFPADPARPTAVVPCLVADERIPSDEAAEAERLARRRGYGLSGDEWVVAYAGSLAPWQEVPRVLAAVRHATERVPQLRLLLLTPARNEAQALVARAGIAPGRVLVRSPGPDEVVAHLLGADGAVLLRRPALANTLAFPTKLAEYLAAGLEVVASDAVPCVAATLARTPGAGHVVPWAADDATWAARIAGAARPGTAAERAARRTLARRTLALSTGVTAYRDLYARLGTRAAG